MKTFNFCLVVIAVLVGYEGNAQENLFNVSGYLETYYGYDFNKPVDNNRPGFVYSHNRHNEVNINLAFIKGNYNSGKIRANLALMTGTYANANLVAEAGVLKNIFEANAGLKLSENADLWLDVGVFPSHIGYESAVSKDCWALTRNISWDNTPYYESGAKVSYTDKSKKWFLTALYLNGWQRITRQSGNSKPAGGLQINYKPTEKASINYSNYIGTEGADSAGVRRFYNNLYGVFQLSDALGLTVGFDYGIQQKAKGSSGYNKVYSPVAVLRYGFNNKFFAAARAEYYEDEDRIIVSTGTPQGFKTTGYSLNFDYYPVQNAVLRVEGKVFDTKDKVYVRNNVAVNHSAILTASLAVSF